MNFETVIGLEIHAELSTKTKIFCSCPTTFGAEPNAHTCPVCLGLPGTLPVLNEEVINLALKAGLALNCGINFINKFDRKNYFYPDLPKAYQISQFDLPICKNGYVDIEVDGIKKRVTLNRIHIEEDAGKLVHLEDEKISLVDYNRVGVPLVEIVSEPDMRSPMEAVEFLRTLRAILEYAGISDCKMEEGSLRCDANISTRILGDTQLNAKVEIKNMNSFKELQKALEKEEKRQRELYTYGEEYKIKQETRRWDSGKGRTVPMRSKEDAHDYRYFPDPDLLPIIIKQAQLDEIEKTLPELPDAKIKRFLNAFNLSKNEVEILVDDKALADYFEALVSEGCNPKSAANWVIGDLLKLLKEKEISSKHIPVNEHSLFKLMDLIEKGSISITAAKEVFEVMFTKMWEPEEVIKEKGLSQISSEDALGALIEEVIVENPASLNDYKSGKLQALGFMMGQIMKKSKGQANPKLVKEMLETKLKGL
ncbi:MAG TPA: Asp-tRNA(Asn)/Glu-tRNA(Gln) amidotransferase subunit GatB [Clostridiaceae bacterium]